MTSPAIPFIRHDLHALGQREIAAAAHDLDLPNLAPFLASIARAQASAAGGTVRTYLCDLIRRGWFEIVSPRTGRVLRSGCSLVLVDKAVVFSFPDEPTLLLGIGDTSLGYPICAAMLTDRSLLLGLIATDWGFSERHLPNLAEVIEATGWLPAPAVGPLNLVLGDFNFAHHAWNQLSGLEELVQKGVLGKDALDRVRMIVTCQPLGPIREIFPELARCPLESTRDTGLQSFNAPGALFAPVGGKIIKASLVRRLMAVAEVRVSPRCAAIRAALTSVAGPVLWISVRTRNRTLTNQHDVLTALGRSFLNLAPTGAIVIDGFSLGSDLDSYPPYHKDTVNNVLAADVVAAEAIYQALRKRHLNGRIHVAVGLTITDTILLSRCADIYFCHHGTVQHKIGWFASVPGVVHSNRATLATTPSAWVAAQSELALPPLYLSPDIVSDADVTAGANTKFGHLLNHDNYTITDIPAAIDTFFRHVAASNISGVSRPRP